MSDINRHLPDYYDGVLEMAEIMQADGVALDQLDGTIERTFLNLYVLKADSDGLRMLEDAYNIPYDQTLNLETRRYNLIIKLLPPRPITERYFKELLNSVAIKAKLDIDAVADTFRAELDAAQSNEHQLAQLDDLIKTYVPANLACKIYNLNYNETTAYNFIGTANQLKVKTVAFCKDDI